MKLPMKCICLQYYTGQNSIYNSQFSCEYYIEITLGNMSIPTIKLQINIMLRLSYNYVNRTLRRVPLVEQKLLILPDYLSSPWFLVGFVLLDL